MGVASPHEMGAEVRIFAPAGLPLMDFDDAGRMKPSPDCERVVDVMEELMKFTLLTRDVAPYRVDHYCQRRDNAAELSRRVNQQGL